MFDHDPQATIEHRDFARTGVWTLRAPMLALSQPDPALAFPEGTTLRPELFIRNTTAKPEAVSLSFNWRNLSTAGKALGPTLRLAPFETRRVDVVALQDGKTLPKDANWTAVVMTTSGLPDEVMAIAASYDKTLRYGAQTPFSDQLSFKWEGGPWEYDGQHDSIISAGNGGTKPTKAAFTIFYNQGKEKYELEQNLQPNEQMWVDIGKLVREQLPDKNGKLLPADLTLGTYEIRDLTDTGIGTLFEGKVIYDKTYGHVAYGCANCCAYSRFGLNFNPLNFILGGLGLNGVEAWDDCADAFENVSPTFYGNWSTANQAIAIVDAGGKHTGMGVGSTTSATKGVIASQAPRACPVIQQGAGGGDNVVTLGCPVTVARGSSATCTVTGPSGTTVSGWEFKDGGGNTVTRSTNKTALTWSGVIVTSGTVSVTANGMPLTASVAVTNRSNFAFTAVSPTQATGNSITCYNGDNTNLVSPPNSTSFKGASCADLAFSFTNAQISDNGPNNGYQYVTSLSDTGGSQPTQFPYIVVSDLLSATTFYNAQCGNYSSSNSAGFIAGSQLKQNVFDHEQGSVMSHWTEYRDAQNNPSNNVGAVLEAMTAPPGTSQSAYQTNLTNAGKTALSNIVTAANNEPCGEDPTEDSSQSCAKCGAINYNPYKSCSGQPVPYCH